MKSIEYKGMPLVRKGKEMFYGLPEKGYVCHLYIDRERDLLGTDGRLQSKIPSNIRITLVECHTTGMKFTNKISVKSSFYEAIDLAYSWISNNARA